MAIVHISYCNGSLGKTVSFDFDNASKAISNPVVGGVCGSPVANGATVYNDFGPYGLAYQGSIYAINVSPYGSFSGIGGGTFAFTSIPVVNASDNITANGSITINVANGNLYTSYSIDGGVTFQVSNIFTNLLPGTYNVVARTSGFFGGTEVITQAVVVGFTAIVCNLALGSITTESAAGANGKIKILNVTGYVYPVEYRLDAGAWQDAAEFTGLIAGTYNVQARYKSYTSCSDNRNVEVTEADSCDLSIVGVRIGHEQSKYADDGAIEITASSSASNFQYSIDGGDNFQSLNSFIDLSPGVYEIAVVDDNGCTDTRTVEVLAYKKPLIVFPLINAHRFVVLTGPTVKPLQNLDNRLFAALKSPGVVRHCYKELRQKDDTSTVQFRSSYSSNVIKVRDADGVVVATVAPVKKTSNFGKSETLAALFADYGANKTQVFFEAGIPLFFEVGQDITITDNVPLAGTYEIVDRAQGIGGADGYEVLIIEKIYSGGTLSSGTVTVEYNLDEFEIYEFVILWTLFAVGEYYFTAEGSDDQFIPYTAQSEPVDLQVKHTDTLLLTCKNYEDAYLIKYGTGIIHNYRFKGVLRWPTTKGERTMHRDSKGRTLKLEESLSRVVEFKMFDSPSYLLERVGVAFGHDFFDLDGVEFQCAEDFDPEYFENDDKHNGKANLIEVDFLAENGDDAGADDIDVLGDNETLLGVL